MPSPKSGNRLANETSPYLLQHAHNPVDWYPWGPEALKLAKKEDKPIFLSIGYSACHWCHVMERESFEDPETAKIMNRYFVNIKVDREERPDLDHIYMSAVQALTQQGGWPMSVFLTPSLEPFYGGTYFPPEDRGHLPAFKKLLGGLAHAWATRKEEMEQSAHQIAIALRQFAEKKAEPSDAVSEELFEGAYAKILEHFDRENGGLGNAPKFFHSMDLQLCLRDKGQRETLKEVLHTTLQAWSRGGIRDHLGGGFHRYSTDSLWKVPHFEKMLYDNALVADCLLEASLKEPNKEYEDAARTTLDYVLREMTGEEGGFFSTQDADSDGEEGKFYLWAWDELHSLLDEDTAKIFCNYYNIEKDGNWGDQNILHSTETIDKAAAKLGIAIDELEESLALARRKLLKERDKRVKPAKDEKILASWNGLMISAMAKGYQVLEDQRYLEGAQKAAGFALEHLFLHDNDGQMILLHSHSKGKARFKAYLDDYSHLIHGLIQLYQADFNFQWVKFACQLADILIRDFWDEERESLFYTGSHHEQLFTRPKDTHDGATPSATSMATTVLLKLGTLTGNNKYFDYGERSLRSHEPIMKQIPMSCPQMLLAAHFYLSPPTQIYIAEGSDSGVLKKACALIRHQFAPSTQVAVRKSGIEPEGLFEAMPGIKDKIALEGKTTFYLCRNYTCLPPITKLSDFEEKLRENGALNG